MGTDERDRGLKKEFHRIMRERIEHLRSERNMSYYTLAYRASIALSSLMNIVDGASSNPGIYNIVKICDGLGVTLSEFFDTKEFEDFIIESRNEN